jgi:hypothetical protein
MRHWTKGMRMKWGKKIKAPRVKSSRWNDLRLWLGVGLLLGSMFIGARVMASGEETVTVWRATQDLAVGSGVSSSNSTIESVVVPARGLNGSYAVGPEGPSGVMLRAVGSGELIPASAVGPELEPQHRIMTIPMDPLHIAVGLNSGDQVDVWSSPDQSRVSASFGSDSSEVVGASLILSNVTVLNIASDVVGTGGDIGVVLAVPMDSVAILVQAVRSGVIDLVQVPLESTVLK